MHFSHLATLAGLILCTLPSALASPAPNAAPIDSSQSTPVVQKNVYEYISGEQSSTVNSVIPTSTSTSTSSAPELVSMMHPLSVGILAAASVFATVL
ncbi:hypothetical protein M413DRAFT_446534 [Hebeloma cylindrosporum]|uniref:Uncharacterized protein n=1 Tax=Hebeloma cylindrosporum TaxID=76867 RepID=A0A0C2YGY2_HEBCY|nr:hypothetical protein M413DRAFT_446534 [Hebeloma cylindrosporum h7]